MNFFVRFRICLKKTTAETTSPVESLMTEKECVIQNPISELMIQNKAKISSDTEDSTSAECSAEPVSVPIKMLNSSESSTPSRYHPYGYNKAKSANSEVDKCEIQGLSNFQIQKLEFQTSFGSDLPILTLSMAKMLIISALTEDMASICKVINHIGYYMRQSWKAYQSHRKIQIMCIRERSAS